MNVKHSNAPEFEAMVGQRLLNAPDQKAECLDLIQTIIRATEQATGQATEQTTGQPDHSPLDPGYILIEALLQLSSRVHFDSGLYKGEVKLEITQEEALRLAPMLMPTIQKLMEEELPEELENLLFDEMNDRAVRALSEIPLGEYTALAKATLKRIHQDDSTRTWRQEAPPLDSPDDGKLAQAEYTALKATMKRIHQEDSTKTWIQEAPPPDAPDNGKPVNEHSFRLLISHVDGHATALLVCLKCQHVLMDTGPGHDTDTPEGLRCDHTNRQPLMDYLGEDRTEDLEP